MSYSRPATRANPACIVLLVDQSLSMGEEFAGDRSTTKCEGTARAINRLLLDLIVLCDKDPGALPRPYYDVGVIGYGATVGPAWGGELRGRSLVSIPDLALHPIDPDEAYPGFTEAAFAISKAWLRSEGEIIADHAGDDHLIDALAATLAETDAAPVDVPECMVVYSAGEGSDLCALSRYGTAGAAMLIPAAQTHTFFALWQEHFS